MTSPATSRGDLTVYRAREKEYEKARRDALERQTEAPTLLWRSAAKTISLATGATTFWLKTGVGAAKWGLAASRQTTNAVIGLNQSVLEYVLRAGGRDLNERTQLALRQEQAEHLVDRWVSSLHTTLTAASLLAATGFYVAETTLDWSSESSLNGLHFLNALFGSTDASRAVAAIVEVMKKEYDKPGPDGRVNSVHAYELLTTVASFLFLQRSGRRKTEMAWRSACGDTTIWDIVIDDKGFRADVLGTRRPEVVANANTVLQSPTVEDPNDEFAAIARGVEEDVLSNTLALSAHDQTKLTDEEIRQRISEQLPPGSIATITSETMLVKTIKVDIHGSETTEIEPPPGMVMVSEHPNFDNSSDIQTVVFRTASKAASTAHVGPNEQLGLDNVDASESLESDDTGTTVQAGLSHHSSGPSTQSNISTDASSTADETDQRVSNDAQNASAAPVANQKKTRKAVPESASPPATRRTTASQAKRGKERVPANDRTEKNEIGEGLKSPSPTRSSAALKRIVPTSLRSRSSSGGGFTNALSQTLRPLTSAKDSSKKPIFHVPVTQPTTPLMSPGRTTPAAYESQGAGYFTVHEKRRESTYSQTDTYSLHSNDSRPPSPTMSRAHLKASNSISKTCSQTEISMYSNLDDLAEQDSLHHRRSHSFGASLYSMGTKNCAEDPLVLAPKTPMPRRSIFEDNKMLIALARDGIVPGQFPERHLIWTLRRFGRSATAAYGQGFLRFMGLPVEPELLAKSREVVKKDIHHEHVSFATYTGFPEETIIKSSYLEPQGFERTYSDEFAPLIHFITIDLESKAIVLTCRGTLGFEDILTDSACDSADLYWQGQAYQVHRGIRDAARRLMDSRNGNNIMSILKENLEEFPEFGLVLVGHSLGGAVAAVLAIMLSEPSKHEPGEADKPSFVTSRRQKLLPSQAHTAAMKDIPPVALPAGRPIHVYAFGSPACVSPALRVATRGLITTVINANDIIPYLSLGTLQDFKAVARRLKEDVSGAFTNIRQRVSERLVSGVVSFFKTGYSHSEATAGPPPSSDLAGDGLGEDTWMWNELVEMRKVMVNEKLVPPGEIFTLESTRVFDRDPDETTTGGAEQAKHYTPLGRPATRVQLKYVRDVEKRFSEIRFTKSMFLEHTPYHYENNLSALERGVYDYAV
ncbi:hypothetical protein LTR70_001182 [Exophiala xenobiotica]|uniref:sn-1-specific diacylglycerol lipase n=1 Tax=Lithohypha guttulata TaxID=1690604 RepID=A0ABR0K8W8_9EURO|nr:hypothetical protein LTR24_005767 [Lithohypha guttulata]KAK5328157.1 hypothetical protein LTR70_001182 [Exophiala xenobiotica]